MCRLKYSECRFIKAHDAQGDFENKLFQNLILHSSYIMLTKRACSFFRGKDEISGSYTNPKQDYSNGLDGVNTHSDHIFSALKGTCTETDKQCNSQSGVVVASALECILLSRSCELLYIFI